jgi:hypothetical protein
MAAPPLPPGFTLAKRTSGPPPLPPGFTLDKSNPSSRKGDLGAAPLPGAMSAAQADETSTPAPAAPDEGSFLGSVLHGQTFGFEDELAGAIAGVVAKATGEDYGTAYRTLRDQFRQAQSSYATNHPVKNFAGQMLGAASTLPVTGGLGVARAGAGLLERIASSGLGAAIYGALTGAGESEGGLPDRLEAAGKGAVAGAATGAALPVAAKGAGILVKPAAAVGRTALNALYGLTGAGEGAAGKQAAQRFLKAIEGDTGQPASRAADALSAAQAADVPLLAGDLGRRRTESLTREAIKASPEGQNILAAATEPRISDRVARTADYIDSLSQRGNRTPDAWRDLLKTAAEQANAPRYKAAYAAPEAQSVWTPTLRQLTVSPTVQRAIAGAEKSSREEAAATGTGHVVNPFVKQADGTLALKPGVTPSLAFWDHVKRGLDRAYGRAQDNTTRREIERVRSLLTNELDATVPAFRHARGVAERFFEARNALDAGEKAVTMKAQNTALRNAVSQMTPEERKLAAEGYLDRLSRQVRESGGLQKTLNTEGALERHAIFLGPQRARQIDERLRMENLMGRFETAVKNAPGQVRNLLRDIGVSGGIGGLGGFLVGGGDWSDPKRIATAALTAAIFAGARRGSINFDERVMRRVAEMLASDDPQTIDRALQVVRRNEKLSQALRLGQQTLSRALTPLVEGDRGGPQPAAAQQ